MSPPSREASVGFTLLFLVDLILSCFGNVTSRRRFPLKIYFSFLFSFFFLFQLTVQFAIQDYPQIQAEQNLRVTFEEFPLQLIELLRDLKPLNDPAANHPSKSVNLFTLPALPCIHVLDSPNGLHASPVRFTFAGANAVWRWCLSLGLGWILWKCTGSKS